MPLVEELVNPSSGGSDESGSSLEMPFFDIDEFAMSSFQDADLYGWDDQPSTSPSLSAGVQESNFATPLIDLSRSENHGTLDDMIAQMMTISNRAIRAARSLDRTTGRDKPLIVSSPEVNEAFETANTLVHLINNITVADSAASSTNDPHDSIFLVLASHQQVLTLFKAICASIQRSVGFKFPTDCAEQHQQEPAFHNDSASCAQFVMVLQLVMHLINRLGRSLRLHSRQNSFQPEASGYLDSVTVLQCNKSTREQEGEGKGERAFTSPVDAAQYVLQRLPDGHGRLKQLIEQLQTHMEERLHVSNERSAS